MRKNLFKQALSAVTLAFIVIVVGRYVIIAQAPITGTWTAEARVDTKTRHNDDDNNWAGDVKQGPRLQLNFSRTSARGGHNSNGSTFLYNELQGLSQQQTENGRVSFSLVREAGTINCEGTFVNGKGSGTFTFSPNRGFIDAMRSRGFDFEKAVDAKHSDTIDDRLFTAAMVNVTSALADGLNSANFGELQVEDLFSAAIFRIDGKYMAEMKATGFPNLSMQDLVQARIFKIDAGYVAQMSSSGFPNLSMEKLVQARIFKIDADYLRQLHDLGFDNRNFEELVQFKVFKVTPEFLNELKSAGLGKLSAEEVVQTRVFNITPDFVRQQKAANPNVTIEDLVQLKIGVGARIKNKIGN